MKKLNIASLGIAVIILLFVTVTIGINRHYTHYVGNDYFPADAYLIFILLAFMLAGAELISHWQSTFTNIVKRLCIIYLFLSLMALLTTAVQYTPFSPIDHSLLHLDNLLLFNTGNVMNWVHEHTYLAPLLAFCYGFLNWELVFIFCFIILFEDKDNQDTFYFLMLFTALIGFAFYYFFPTTGPASMITNAHFYKEQYDTGLKFFQIHQHQHPSTMEGGLIALPSFHFIWAFICQYHLRKYRILWYVFLPFNILLIAACVMLGWHYLIDMFASLFLVLLALNVRHILKTKSMQ